MNYLTQKLRHFTNYFVKVKEETLDENKVISRYKYYLEFTYKILSWEEPSLTWTVLLVLNFLFWLTVQFELGVLGVILPALLIGFVFDLYFKKTHPEPIQSRYSESIKELCDVVWPVVCTIRALRKESPSSFCGCMCIIFLTLSFIARNISGYFLFYLNFHAVFFLPLLASKIPPEYLEGIKQFFISISSEKDVLAEEDLIPFISDKDFSTNDPELESQLTDRTVDSVTNSLISGISAMPSYLDDEDLSRDIEEDDLLPLKNGANYTPGDLSSESDSEHRDIHFEPTHFNGDTSDEDEKLFGKGLKFVGTDTIDDGAKAKQAVQGLSQMISNVASSVGNRIVSNIIQTAVSARPIRKESSSDSEFEIINSDDLKEQT